MNADKPVNSARRNVWEANWRDRRTHTVIIVHTCGSCNVLISGLKNSFVIGNFDLHIFQFKINFVTFSRFLRVKFSQEPRHRFAYQLLDNYEINKYEI